LRQIRRRTEELSAAVRIVDRETDGSIADPRHRTLGPMIERLQQRWHDPKTEELQRLLNKLPQLDDRARGEIRRSFDRLVNTLLDPPLESLRQESGQSASSGFQEAVARLFRLED
jgi:glutamyl-tRNA reductase